LEAFWKAQEKIYQVLEEQFYHAFLLSDLFHCYAKKRTEGQIATSSFLIISGQIAVFLSFAVAAAASVKMSLVVIICVIIIFVLYFWFAISLAVSYN